MIDQTITRTDILKLSHEELDVLVPLVPDKILSMQDRAARLLGSPGPDLIILTRGEKPSIWVSHQGTIHPPVYESRPLIMADTVGAGDAYAAMAAAARLSNIPNTRAMGLAQ